MDVAEQGHAGPGPGGGDRRRQLETPDVALLPGAPDGEQLGGRWVGVVQVLEQRRLLVEGEELRPVDMRRFRQSRAGGRQERQHHQTRRQA
jgi:hypothetical protein